MVGFEEEEELYCMAMKVLLGLEVSPSCYKLVVQKYTNVEDIIDTIEIQPKKEINDCHGTKRMITMNAIQSKMQKRKQKSTKVDRSSIMMFPTNRTL